MAPHSSDQVNSAAEHDDYRNYDDMGEQVRIALTLAPDCRDRSLEVPSEPLAVPSKLTHSGLSAVVNHLLSDRVGSADDQALSDPDQDGPSGGDRPIPFEFVLRTSDKLSHRLLRGSVEAQARRLGWSLEEAIPVTYFPARRYRPSDDDPKPQLPDWISSLQYRPHQSLLLSGCYDGSFAVVATKAGSTAQVVPAAHSGPIKSMISWSYDSAITSQANHDDPALFVATGSMDHTLRIHRLERRAVQTLGGSADSWDASLAACCGGTAQAGGHTSSVEALDVAANRRWLASGDFDGTLCLWDVGESSIQEAGAAAASEPAGASKSKKSKASSGASLPTKAGDVAPTLNPKTSLRAHAAAISGLSWGNHHCRNEAAGDPSSSSCERLITSSWDHSLRLWDVERQDAILTLNGSRVVTCLDSSYHAPGIIATGHPDCAVRCWDLRVPHESAPSGTIVAPATTLSVAGTTLKPSHKAWISAVQWDPDSPYHLVSASHDSTVKFWDIRSSLPLQTLRIADDKEEKTLAVTLGPDGCGFAAGTEGRVKSFTRITH